MLSRRLSGGVADGVVVESGGVVSLVITGAPTLASAIVAGVLTSILTWKRVGLWLYASLVSATFCFLFGQQPVHVECFASANIHTI